MVKYLYVRPEFNAQNPPEKGCTQEPILVIFPLKRQSSLASHPGALGEIQATNRLSQKRLDRA